MTCVVCDEEFTQKGGSKKMIYCSDKCNKKAYRQRNKRSHYTCCQHCGNEINSGRIDKRYCSHSCRQKSYMIRNGYA